LARTEDVRRRKRRHDRAIGVKTYSLTVRDAPLLTRPLSPARDQRLPPRTGFPPLRGRGGAVSLALGILAAIWPLLSATGRRTRDDVDLYYGYAHAFWFAPPRFHALPVEYPPLALLPFTLTLLPPFAQYHVVFACWMGACAVLGYVGFRRFSTRDRAAAYAVYLLVGAPMVLLARFDLVPALLTVAAWWAAQRQRYRLAYLLIAVGALLKFYPIVLLPLLLIEHGRVLTAQNAHTATPSARPFIAHSDPASPHRLWALYRSAALLQVTRAAGPAVVCVALGFAGAGLLNAQGTLSPFHHVLVRPVQVESTPATLLWLGTWLGYPAQPTVSYSSHNYVGPLDALLIPMSLVAVAAGCVWVYWRQLRGHLAVGQAMLACLCVVVAFNKVFSAQYLLWLIPLVAAVEGWDYLWLAICGLTTLEYPILHYLLSEHWTHAYDPLFMGVLAVRNGLLIYALYRAIRPHSGVERRLNDERPEGRKGKEERQRRQQTVPVSRA
jgi:hypothetical protein